MSIAFVIPGHLRQFTGGRGQVLVEGGAASVSAALSLLWAAHPAVRDRVLTELGEVRAHINVFVDGENIRNSGGLATPIRDGAEIVILPAISGGLPRLRVRRLPR